MGLKSNSCVPCRTIVSQKCQQSSLKPSKYWYSVGNIRISHIEYLFESSVTFTHADGAALPVLSIAVAAVLVAGEGRTLDAATHLTAVLVPPAGQQRTHIHHKANVCKTQLLTENIMNTSKSNVVLWLETNHFFAHLDKRSCAEAAEAENGASGSNYPPIKTWMCCWFINDRNWNERMSSIHNCPTRDVLSALPCPHSTIF